MLVMIDTMERGILYSLGGNRKLISRLWDEKVNDLRICFQLKETSY
jgi:hypothetical protein